MARGTAFLPEPPRDILDNVMADQSPLVEQVQALEQGLFSLLTESMAGLSGRSTRVEAKGPLVLSRYDVIRDILTLSFCLFWVFLKIN
jgi:hypothetical protein